MTNKKVTLDSFIDAQYTFHDKGLSERYRKLLEVFEKITKCDKDGCHSYNFILSLTDLEERFAKDIYESAQEILDNYVYYTESEKGEDNKISKDVAFTAFYYMALVHARYEDKESLKSVLSQYYRWFIDDYANVYELFARYCLSNNDFKKSLSLVDIAERSLKKMNCERNVALGVTYAMSIASIAEYCFLHKCIYREDKNHKSDDVSVDSQDDRKKIAELALESVGPYVYDGYALEEEMFTNALSRLADAMEVNPDYPKYPYLKAKLCFYASFYDDNKLSEKEKEEVLKNIEGANERLSESNKNYHSLKEQYDSFLEIVKNCPIDSENWNTTTEYMFAAAKSNIIRSTDPKQTQPATYDKQTKAPYVFVSYSSRDFRTVYCDMIEYKKQGILCDYDNDMTSYGHISDTEKQKWYIVVEEKIRNASCILCYLSENYVVSKASLFELKLAEKYKKPLIAIDLGGDYRISALFMRVAKNPELAPLITSDSLYWFCKKFDDDNNVIARAKDPLSVKHKTDVKNRLSSLCPEVINSFSSECKTLINRGKNHPMEDAVYFDKEHNVYVVADGITRQDPKEYERCKGFSISAEVSNKFCYAFGEAFVSDSFESNESKYIYDKFIRAFKEANREVARLVADYKRVEGTELPGTVAIASAIRNDTLYFGSVGDCMGILVRNGRKIVFSDKQTTYAFDKAGVERDRDLLQKKYINKPDNSYGYGVINGEEKAVDFFNVGHLSLEYGDTVYLVSDGIADYIRYCNPAVYADMPIEDIISSAVRLEEELYKEKRSRSKNENNKNADTEKCPHDDMAIIRIKWTSNSKNLIIE